MHFCRYCVSKKYTLPACVLTSHILKVKPHFQTDVDPKNPIKTGTRSDKKKGSRDADTGIC